MEEKKKVEKNKKFAELFEKFTRKCLQEGMFPVSIINGSLTGILPAIDYYEV